MTMKGRTTVYVDMDKAKRIREDLGIDLSTLTSTAIDIAASDIFGDVAIGIRTKMIEELIQETTDEIGKLDARRIVLQKRLTDTLASKQKLMDDWQRTKKEVALAEYIYELNQVIISGQYDVNVVRSSAAETIAKIESISPLWQLDIHVKDLKKAMEKFG